MMNPSFAEHSSILKGCMYSPKFIGFGLGTFFVRKAQFDKLL